MAIGRKASNGSRLWTMLAGLVNCPLCIGVWLSAIMGTMILCFDAWLINLFILIFGIAGAQFGLQMNAGYMEND